MHGLLAGRIVRILVDGGVLELAEAARRLAAQLSIGTPPDRQAAWVEGLLAGGGLLLVHDRDLLDLLDSWVAELAEEDFLVVLPLLRRTFGEYTRPERAELGRAVHRLTDSSATAAEEPIDERRAAPAVAAVAAILVGAR